MMNMTTFKRPTILSLEQALSMSYATLRFVHQGWRVIRIESTPVSGRASKGDPNRFIGRPIAGEDRHSYYIAPNVGKEAIALNLKTIEGQALLHQLILELDVDIFCTNTMPARHQALGIDAHTLQEIKPDLIWCCISAMGCAYPEVPGYDPVIQALCGYMDLTGPGDGPPMQCGPPIIDLKAGDEAFTQVALGLLERQQGKTGAVIDISMAQIAASWLHTFLPMLDMDSPPQELKRSGNEHRQFIPVNAYPTVDGYIYLAIGSDAQWQRLVRAAMFASLDQPHLASNEGRRAHKHALHDAIGKITSAYSSARIAEVLADAAIPNAPITPIEGVMELPFIAEQLLHTNAPDGRIIRLPPPAVATPYLKEQRGQLSFAPSYAEHTEAVLQEAGIKPAAIDELRTNGVIS